MPYRIFEYEGERKNIVEWSNDPRCKVSKAGLLNRIYRLKWPFNDALLKVNNNDGNIFFYEGESKNLWEWAKDKRCHVTHTTLCARLKIGYEFKDALLAYNFNNFSPRPGVKINKLTILDTYKITKDNKKPKIVCLCECDCGQKKEIQKSKVLNGVTRSCGCALTAWAKSRKFEDGHAARNCKFLAYKKSAGQRGLQFDLTKEECLHLFSQNCHYCNSPPSQIYQITRTKDFFLYNGIDRVDNNQGYIKNNVVTCCKICNVSKLGRTVEEFKRNIGKCYAHTFNNYDKIEYFI